MLITTIVTSLIITNIVGTAFAALPVSGYNLPSLAPLTVVLEAPEKADAPAEIPKREEAVKNYRVPVTAYSSTPDQTDDTPFITANGSRVRDGIIAANFLPFGTRVRFPELFGDKVFTVEDRMNARYFYRADIWMESRAAAWEFGIKRKVLVEVLLTEEREVARK